MYKRQAVELEATEVIIPTNTTLPIAPAIVLRVFISAVPCDVKLLSILLTPHVIIGVSIHPMAA